MAPLLVEPHTALGNLMKAIAKYKIHARHVYPLTSLPKNQQKSDICFFDRLAFNIFFSDKPKRCVL